MNTDEIKLLRENKELLLENRSLLKENMSLEKKIARLKEKESSVHKAKTRLTSAINYVQYIKDRYSDIIGDVLPITEETSVRDLPISVRTKNSLIGNDIRIFGQLKNISYREMMTFRNFGYKSLQEVKNVIENIENIKL